MLPLTHHLYDAIVDVGPRRDMGTTALGQRFIIDILGGSFEGASDTQVLRGTVLPGGADRQLLRSDGVKELDALYEMQTHDGAIITVHNRVIIDDSRTPATNRYARSHVKLTAPDGPYGWINRRVFVGTLTALPPERKAVKISVFLLD